MESKSQSSILNLEGVTKTFHPGKKVVRDVGIDLLEGAIVALLGPSGCGKTTLLRMIAGFETPDSGHIRLHGRMLNGSGVFVPPQKRGIGFVFQDYALFPHLTALENVAFGLTQIPRHKRPVYAEEVLCRTGMKEHLHRYPSQLSGGQQQRVALARAIAPKPALVLLDEPFSNLDAMLRDVTRNEVRDILRKSGMSAILVTHDQEEALSFADELLVMNEGRIEQAGHPEDVYYHPGNAFVARFLGRTNLIQGEGQGAPSLRTFFGDLPVDRPVRGATLCCLRPEQLTLEPKDPLRTSPGDGIVEDRKFNGHDITYIVGIGDQRLVVHTDNRITFSVREQVTVRALEPATLLT